MSDGPLLEAIAVSRRYTVAAGGLKRRTIEAVKSVDLEMYPDEIVALVGQSGSGKTTLGRMMVGLVTPSDGTIIHKGSPLTGRHRKELRAFRRHASIVFQNPFHSLNPRMRIGTAIAEALKVSRAVPSAEIPDEVDRLLASVELPGSYERKYPLALSGGEQQRVAIARALAVRPDFLVADEPTSALDVSVAAQVLNILLEVKRKQSFACLFITHDLALATAMADRLLIMQAGEIIEAGTPEELTLRPKTAYTKELLGTLHSVGGPAAPSQADRGELGTEAPT